nr:PREDICTED: uncharacterized protein LOC107076604 [Lepisosteus oculatus]
MYNEVIEPEHHRLTECSISFSGSQEGRPPPCESTLPAPPPVGMGGWQARLSKTNPNSPLYQSPGAEISVCTKIHHKCPPSSGSAAPEPGQGNGTDKTRRSGSDSFSLCKSRPHHRTDRARTGPRLRRNPGVSYFDLRNTIDDKRQVSRRMKRRRQSDGSDASCNWASEGFSRATQSRPGTQTRRAGLRHSDKDPCPQGGSFSCDGLLLLGA